MEKAEHAEPIEAMDSTEPTEPIESTDPRDAMHRTESSDRSDHRDPATAASSLRRVVPRIVPTEPNRVDPNRQSRRSRPAQRCHTAGMDARQPGTVPDPALIVLIGPSGSGKSTWAAARYRAAEIVSSDALRAVVGSGEHDLAASQDAFMVLDQIVAVRIRRGLTTVVDTLGLEPSRRQNYLHQARQAGLPAVAVLFGLQPQLCRDRNRSRERPVPAPVLDSQLRRMAAVVGEVDAEPWGLVLDGAAAVEVEPAHSPGAAAARRRQQAVPTGLTFVLQVSRFRWRDDPTSWLTGIAQAAGDAGFDGLALMDHLIQIPQVDRAWEPIPEPWVALGLLAGLSGGLRLGTLVTPVTFRPAGIVAKTVATLDVLSGGRAFLGLGAGWWGREHAAFGLPFPPVADRRQMLAVAVETIRALWQPGTKAYAGERISLPETTCYPRPVSGIPIIIGGAGAQTRRIAARAGDGYNLPSADLATVQRAVASLQEMCRQAGRDPKEVAMTVLDTPVIGRDRDEITAVVERERGGASAQAFARRHHAGTPDDHVGRYRLLADCGVRTVFLALPDLAGPDDMERVAPIITAFR
jgi:alkanesulfonate monooxygenase SsuD/methylene tetrahydromethanopterin reductase-like flavin-dependent oxidoreductase (luciferase family)/predicted kinase